MANLKPKVLSNNGADKLLDDNDNLVLVKSPVEDTHGANKKYVDDTTTALGNLLDGKIDDTNTDLSNETAARIAADTALQDAIDAEEAARIAADSTEASTRQTKDDELQTQIDAITGGSLDTSYVKKIGDNMTGTLTINTNKIILDKDGEATFAGSLEAASIDGGSY